MALEEAGIVRDLEALRHARIAILRAIELLEARERLPSAREDDTMGAMSASAIAPVGGYRHHRGQRPKGDGPVDAVSARTGKSLRQIAGEIGISPNTLKSANRRAAEGETELSEAVNLLGVGPQGLGGDATAFAVHVELAATHITMNPVAVNMQCHSARRASALFTETGIAYGY